MSLTYEVPEWASGIILPGMRAVVPFRQRHVVGVVVRLLDETSVAKTRAITELPDEKPLFTPEILRLLNWISDYYSCSRGDAFRAALPGGIGIDVEREIALAGEEADREGLSAKAGRLLEILEQRGDLKEEILCKIAGSQGFIKALGELRSRGIIRIRLRTRNKQRPLLVEVARPKLSRAELIELLETIRGNAPKQRELLEFLAEDTSAEHPRRDLSARFGAGAVKTAIERQWLKIETVEVFRRPENDPRLKSKYIGPELTELQLGAAAPIVEAVEAERFEPFLLWGVTGSGKTEVYMRAAAAARDAGKGVLILVPEIALTPQLWGQFEGRFPEEVAVLHSALRPGERFDAWRKLAGGELKIAIGPRSAVFAPVRDLGLIVVDEEHESSYKQDEPPPYYSARDAAVVRASIEGCPVVLGSATPSAESYYNAITGKYRLLELPERIPGAELPGIRIVDMTEEREQFNNYSVFSRVLEGKLVETLEKGYRAMLLLNRRGFSSYLQCPDCGYIPTCESCGIGLTYHKADSTLKCHYCSAEFPAPDTCPVCGSSKIKFRGHGTERIEEELAKIVPQEKIFRLDADSAKAEGVAKILRDFLSTPASVLVGTQMIAKGHDFPDVALVGVLNADIGLVIPDFRSSERIFQLINQVAGRAGRSDIRGEVIIQTYRPDCPAIDFAVNSDVKSFFEFELRSREELKYPPFGRLVRVLALGEDPSEVRTAIFTLTRELARVQAAKRDFTPLGPASCPLSKLRNNYRWHLFLKTDKIKSTLDTVKRIVEKIPGDVRYKIIVDPQNLL